MTPEQARPDVERLEVVLRQLPRRQRIAFLLAARDQHSYDDIARRLGTSVSGVEKLIAKALRRLDRELE